MPNKMKSLILTIIIALIALFAWQNDKAKWKRIYLENRLDYCSQLITAYKTQDSIKIGRAEQLWYYGCTRQK